MSGAEASPEAPQSGPALPDDSAGSPALDKAHPRPGSSRQTAVLLSLTLLAALFLLTGFMTRAFLRHEQELAQEWYHLGQTELSAGHPDAAVEALHNALAYAKDNAAYELLLSQALLAAGRNPQAETYLRTLHESEPGNAPVNLELARLAAKRGDAEEAVRYYLSSVYGVWDANGEQRRRQTRLEMIAYLSAQHRTAEALAQIMSFAANLPPDPSLHLQAGSLFFAQKSYDRALEEFREVLRLNPGNPQALAGAGKSLFESGKFSQALAPLERAHHAAPQEAAVRQWLELARAIVALDPYAPGLSAQTRAGRAVRVFETAAVRQASCAAPQSVAGSPPADLDRRFTEMKPKMKIAALRRDMDLFDSAIALAYQAELHDAATCGPGAVEDQALVVLARQRSGGAQ